MFLKMTMETEEDFENRRLPNLELSLWVNSETIILYTFFEKSMSSNQLLHNETALAEDTIIISLTSEVKRRMFNTSEQLDMKERIIVLDKLYQKMRNSGFQREKIRDIVVAGLKRYERRVEEDKERS